MTDLLVYFDEITEIGCSNYSASNYFFREIINNDSFITFTNYSIFK